MAVISFLRSSRDWSRLVTRCKRGGNDSPRRGEPKDGGKCRTRGRLTRSQSKTSASVARERFSWLLRVFAQLCEPQLAHVSPFTYQRNCAIVPRAVFPDSGGPRACLDSRAFGGKRREACIYVLIYAVSKATRLGSSPPIRGSAYCCGPCAIAVFYGIFSRQDDRLRYRVDSSCVSAGESRVREEGDREKERRNKERDLAVDRSPTVDQEIRAGHVVTRSLAVARILTRKCGHATLPDRPFSRSLRRRRIVVSRETSIR